LITSPWGNVREGRNPVDEALAGEGRR